MPCSYKYIYLSIYPLAFQYRSTPVLLSRRSGLLGVRIWFGGNISCTQIGGYAASIYFLSHSLTCYQHRHLRGQQPRLPFSVARPLFCIRTHSHEWPSATPENSSSLVRSCKLPVAPRVPLWANAAWATQRQLQPWNFFSRPPTPALAQQEPI